MKNFIRRRPIVSFYLVAILFGVLALILRGPSADYFAPFIEHLKAEALPGNTITVLAYSLDHPGFATSLLFPFAPTLAALVIVLLGWGGAGLRDWLTRLKPWREGVTWRQGLPVYLITGAVYVAIAGLVILQAYREGRAAQVDELFAMLGPTSWAAAATLLVLPFVDGGAMLEELGWRGYALPRLMEHFSTPLAAAVVLGIMWGVWHVPRDLPAFLADPAAFGARIGGVAGWLWGWVTFTFATTCSTIVIAYVYNLTGGSVLAAVLVHGAHNTISVNVMRIIGGRTAEIGGTQMDVNTLIGVVLAALVVIFAGSQLGRRRPDATVPLRPTSALP